MHYFNWTELKRDADNDFAGILILTHALVLGYNVKIAKSSRYLLKVLKIDRIPPILFRRKHIFAKNGAIYSSYQCREPQSYFTDCKFLKAHCSEVHKAIYLYILSHRSINNKQNYIPKTYIDEKYWKNPFVRVDDEYIHFIPETRT